MDQDIESMTTQLENKEKSEHARNAIFFYFIFGVILTLVSERKLMSFSTATFLFVGMFCASFLSVPSYLVKKQLAKIMAKKNTTESRAKNISCIYSIFELIYDFFLTWLLFRLSKSIIN